MLWSDHRRYHQTSLTEETHFPNPANYTNLDHFLHDIRLAVNQEKKYRRLHNLTTDEARHEHQLERLSLHYDELLQSSDFQFDVI